MKWDHGKRGWGMQTGRRGCADKGGNTGNSRQISLAIVDSCEVQEVGREPVSPKIFTSEISI